MTFQTPVEHFKAKKYVIVDGAADLELCKTLSAHLHRLIEEKKTIRDDQCPLSEAIYKDNIFNTLLQDMKPVIEKATGLSLKPTYSYARKYLPGEKLEPHVDRHSCEISATMTLSYEGEIWPFHISSDDKVENDLGEVIIPVGSMVIYRGLEINHWRNEYTQGKWQCQVFLHYVDENGPYKDLENDTNKRLIEKLLADDAKRDIEKKDEKPENEKFIQECTYWNFGILNDDKYVYMTTENFLSKPLIESIVNYGQGKLYDASIGDGYDGAKIDKNVRNASHCWLPHNAFDWLYRMLESEIRDINWMNYRFNLTHMEAIDYLEYHAGSEEHASSSHGKYTAHVDGSINSTRKLSFSVLLSDPRDFDGGELLLYAHSQNAISIPKKQGMITFFPSGCLHEVTPVTRGVRRSIVSWIRGPHIT